MNTYFVLTVVTIVCGTIILAFKICFASKCESVQLCWGFLKVDRNVVIEDTEFKEETKHSENGTKQMQIEKKFAEIGAELV